MGFSAVQVLSGATVLSELGIDVSKNWGSYLIKNLGDGVDDQDAVTIIQLVGLLLNYLPLLGGTMSGIINMNSHKITNVTDPNNDQDAATKKHVADLLALYLLLTGGTMSGAINMGTNLINNLADPVDDQDAVTKKYLTDYSVTVTQYDQTTNRQLDWTYINDSGKIVVAQIIVILEVNNNGLTLEGLSNIEVYCDSNADPTTLVARKVLNCNLTFDSSAQRDIDNYLTFTVLIPPNWRIKTITSNSGHGAAPVLEAWIESYYF